MNNSTMDLDQRRFEVGRVFEIQNYNYPMIVIGVDRGNRDFCYINLMPAVEVEGSWKTFGAMTVSLPEDLADQYFVKRLC